MQNVFKTAGGLVFAGITTWLAVKDHQYFENLTKETVSQISQDIQTIEKQNPQSDPWLSIAVALALFIGSIAIIFKGRE